MQAALIKLGIDLALFLLQKTGVISGLEAAAIKAGQKGLQAVEGLKTYPEFPSK